MRAVHLACAALLPVALGGCTVIAVGGAVVGAGVGAGVIAAKTGVAVGKGAVAVATYPFRDSKEEAARKAAQKQQQEPDADQPT